MTLYAGFRQLRASAVVLMAVAFTIGCSASDTFEQPAQLPDVNQQVSFERVWNVTVGDGHDGEFLYLAPLNADDVVYAASTDGELLALNAETGKQIWKNSVEDRIFAGVGGDAKQLYLVSRDADLLALSREDGRHCRPKFCRRRSPMAVWWLCKPRMAACWHSMPLTVKNAGSTTVLCRPCRCAPQQRRWSVPTL